MRLRTCSAPNDSQIAGRNALDRKEPKGRPNCESPSSSRCRHLSEAEALPFLMDQCPVTRLPSWPRATRHRRRDRRSRVQRSTREKENRSYGLREPPEWLVHRASSPIALARAAARTQEGTGGKRRRPAASPLPVRRTQSSQWRHILAQREASAGRPQGRRVWLPTLGSRRRLGRGWRTPMRLVGASVGRISAVT
jgi:hypothetical protein